MGDFVISTGAGSCEADRQADFKPSAAAGAGDGTASGGTSTGPLHLGQRIFFPAAASGSRNLPEQLEQATSTVLPAEELAAGSGFAVAAAVGVRGSRKSSAIAAGFEAAAAGSGAGSAFAGSGKGDTPVAASGGTSSGPLHLGQRIFFPAAASGRRNFPSQLGQAASTGMRRVGRVTTRNSFEGERIAGVKLLS